MKLFQKSTAPEGEKLLSLFVKARENPKKPLSVISTSLLVILPFCVCLIGALLFTLYYIRNDAYRYTDDTYKHIEEVLCGVAVSLPNGTTEHQNATVISPDGTEEEISPCIRKGEGIDVRELQNHVDKFDISYDNGQFRLTCSIKDGYFDAVVTTWVTNDFTVTQMSRNYNSLGAYMDNLIRQVGLASLGIALAIFFGVELLIFGVPAAYGYFYNKQEERKKKKEAGTTSSVEEAVDPRKQLISTNPCVGA